jgi:hypothetical protein
MSLSGAKRGNFSLKTPLRRIGECADDAIAEAWRSEPGSKKAQLEKEKASELTRMGEKTGESEKSERDKGRT